MGCPATRGVGRRSGADTRAASWVQLYSPDSKLLDRIEARGKEDDTEIQQYRGTGEFVGGDTRAEGRDAYQRIIDDFEQRYVDRKYNDSGPEQNPDGSTGTEQPGGGTAGAGAGGRAGSGAAGSLDQTLQAPGGKPGAASGLRAPSSRGPSRRTTCSASISRCSTNTPRKSTPPAVDAVPTDVRSCLPRRRQAFSENGVKSVSRS